MPLQMPRTNAESAGLERKVTFFGCDEDGATAIVYLPNRIGTTIHIRPVCLFTCKRMLI